MKSRRDRLNRKLQHQQKKTYTTRQKLVSAENDRTGRSLSNPVRPCLITILGSVDSKYRLGPAYHYSFRQAPDQCRALLVWCTPRRSRCCVGRCSRTLRFSDGAGHWKDLARASLLAARSKLPAWTAETALASKRSSLPKPSSLRRATLGTL